MLGSQVGWLWSLVSTERPCWWFYIVYWSRRGSISIAPPEVNTVSVKRRTGELLLLLFEADPNMFSSVPFLRTFLWGLTMQHVLAAPQILTPPPPPRPHGRGEKCMWNYRCWCPPVDDEMMKWKQTLILSGCQFQSFHRWGFQFDLGAGGWLRLGAAFHYCSLLLSLKSLHPHTGIIESHQKRTLKPTEIIYTTLYYRFLHLVILSFLI